MLDLQEFISRVVCLVIVLRNTATNENESAWNRGHALPDWDDQRTNLLQAATYSKKRGVLHEAALLECGNTARFLKILPFNQFQVEKMQHSKERRNSARFN